MNAPHLSKVHPLLQRAQSVGIHTWTELGRRTGIRAEVFSRATSEGAERRFSLEQMARIASVLECDVAEVARLVLPLGDPELLFCEKMVAELTSLRQEVAAARMGETEARAELRAAESRIGQLSAELGVRHDEATVLRDSLQQVRSHRDVLQAELLTERRRLTTIDEERNRLTVKLDAAEGRVQALKDEAAKEIARLTQQIDEMRDLVGRERVEALRHQALTGAFGIGVGVLLGRATAGETDNGYEDDFGPEDVDD